MRGGGRALAPFRFISKRRLNVVPIRDGRLGCVAAAAASLLFLAACGSQSGTASSPAPSSSVGSCVAASRADRAHENGVWLTVRGTVLRLMPDERGRFTHQRFLLGCSSGLTLLIVNDVSIGTRAPVVVGAPVTVRGQYIWNRLGGLIHFTHRALYGGQGGWIVYGGREYSWITLRTKRWTTV